MDVAICQEAVLFAPGTVKRSRQALRSRSCARLFPSTCLWAKPSRHWPGWGPSRPPGGKRRFFLFWLPPPAWRGEASQKTLTSRNFSNADARELLILLGQFSGLPPGVGRPHHEGQVDVSSFGQCLSLFDRARTQRCPTRHKSGMGELTHRSAQTRPKRPWFFRNVLRLSCRCFLGFPSTISASFLLTRIQQTKPPLGLRVTFILAFFSSHFFRCSSILFKRRIYVNNKLSITVSDGFLDRRPSSRSASDVKLRIGARKTRWEYRNPCEVVNGFHSI